MADRAQRSQEEARQRLLHEIEMSNATIVTLQRQLEVQDDALAKLNADDNGELLVTKEERNPRSIAAEDALDTIVRLENTLKIVQRRNTLLTRENANQEKILKDRSKALERVTKEDASISGATGWNEDIYVDDALEIRRRISEMMGIEQILSKELVSAEVLTKKKEQAVEDLQRELSKKKDKEEDLSVLYNDIRVKDRDCVELQRGIAELNGTHSNTEQLIEVAETKRGTLSIQSLRDDTMSLKNIVDQHRATRRKQDEIIKAQIFRARQLQTRIDIITAALKDMKLDKEFERSIPRSSLVPGAAKDEPADVTEVIPEGEVLPMETYQLLLRDNEAMRTSVARKDVMVLEKEATVQALEAKLESFAHSLNLSTEQQDNLKLHKALEMDDLQEQLQEQHQAYRRQIEELLSHNLKLKSRLTRRGKVLVYPDTITANTKMKF